METTNNMDEQQLNQKVSEMELTTQDGSYLESENKENKDINQDQSKDSLCFDLTNMFKGGFKKSTVRKTKKGEPEDRKTITNLYSTILLKNSNSTCF